MFFTLPLNWKQYTSFQDRLPVNSLKLKDFYEVLSRIHFITAFKWQNSRDASSKHVILLPHTKRVCLRRGRNSATGFFTSRQTFTVCSQLVMSCLLNWCSNDKANLTVTMFPVSLCLGCCPERGQRCAYGVNELLSILQGSLWQ